MSQMDLPDHLAHQPVFALPYFDHDGWRAGDTDCQFLSIGWAQYDAHEISAKTLRHTDQRWSRQSEELPLNRLVDLTTLLAFCLRDAKADAIPVPADFFESQPDQITIERPAAQLGTSKRNIFHRTLLGDKILRRRLKKLLDVLNSLHEQQVI